MIHNSQIKELLVQLAEEQCEKAYKSLFLLLHNRLIEFSAAIVKSQEALLHWDLKHLIYRCAIFILNI